SRYAAGNLSVGRSDLVEDLAGGRGALPHPSLPTQGDRDRALPREGLPPSGTGGLGRPVSGREGTQAAPGTRARTLRLGSRPRRDSEGDHRPGGQSYACAFRTGSPEGSERETRRPAEVGTARLGGDPEPGHPGSREGGRRYGGERAGRAIRPTPGRLARQDSGRGGTARDVPLDSPSRRPHLRRPSVLPFMNRILVLGCGELAWGRPSQSALFGRQWTRGRLSEKIGLGVEGPLTGTTAGLDWVTLADEVERQRAWRPKVPLESAPNLLFRKAQPAKSSLLPTWQELARSQALWATRELGGVGVLVTPKEWRESIAARQLLAAWASEGWSWATLEQVLRKRYSAGTRCVSASGLWVRVLEREGGCTFANGPEAARALELASAILDRAMEQLSPELAGRWRREEESASGWYVHQQLARRIAQALKEGKTTVDLADSTDSGSPSGVLFRFSSHEAQDRYRALSALRVKVVLPAAALPWWDKVSQPNLLFSPEGVAHSGVRWEERKTVLLEG